MRFSLTANRGCFGGCSFCALAFHQGRRVQARSKDSLVREARAMTMQPDFKGYIHDVGGPTADFMAPVVLQCSSNAASAPRRQCLFPEPCRKLEADHAAYLDLLRTLRSLPGREEGLRPLGRYGSTTCSPIRRGTASSASSPSTT